MLRKSPRGFLAFVKDIEKEGVGWEQVPVASKVPDVFPKEISGLPLDGGIEFGIELVLGTRLISIPPYHMTSAELKELKGKLKDRLGKSFIRPSSLP